MKSPRVSVLMTAYNAGDFIAQAIESILIQTYKDFEFIIINDGSTDNSSEIINSFKDKRIRIVSRPNKGRHVSLDEGLALAKGTYTAIMDADDISDKDRLKLQVRYMDEHPECAAVSAFINIINKDGTRLSNWKADRDNFTPRQIRSALPKENCIANPAVLIKTEVLRKFGYRHDQVSEDYDLWLRMLSAGYQIHKTNQALLTYRILPGSVTQTSIGGSVNRKNLEFKITFLKHQLKDRRIGMVELKVFLSLSALIFRMAFKKIRSDFNNLTRLDNKAGQLSPGKSTSKNILFVLPWLEIGGADKVVLDIMEALKSRKNRIYCITTAPSQNRRMDEFERLCDGIYDASHLPMHLGIAESIAEYANNLRIGTIIISNSVSGYVAAEIIKRNSPWTKIVDIVHGQGGIKEDGGIPRHSAPYDKFLDHRVAVTNYIKDLLVKNYGIDRKKITVIHNGIEIPKGAAPSAAKPMRENPGTFKVLWAGRLNDEKHPELVLEIAREVMKSETKIHFIMAGDGDNKQKLIRDLERHELSHIVSLSPEPYDNHRAFMHYADMLLMTSEMEGLPIVILEAFSEGKPVLAPAVGGIPEIVKDGSNGFLLEFKKDFARQAADKILYLSCHKDERVIMGKNGRNEVATNFSLRKMQEKYCEIIL